MKVKIEKEGKTKTYKLIDSWSEVNLEMWTKLIASETGSKTKEAEEIVTALSDIPKKLVNELAIRDVAIIMSKIAELQSEQNTVLKKVFEIDGVEYGMHPDLSEITLGEYADIETMIKQGIEKNMPNIMAVLFRPIINRKGEVYTIEAYDGDLTIRAEEMKKMSAEQVQNALVFFYHLGNAYLKNIQSVLKQRVKELKKQL